MESEVADVKSMSYLFLQTFQLLVSNLPTIAELRSEWVAKTANIEILLSSDICFRNQYFTGRPNSKPLITISVRHIFKLVEFKTTEGEN